MKNGDVVRCIDNKRLDNEPQIDYLTEGKLYTVVSTQDEFITIENDIDKVHAYYASRFELVEEYCNLKIGDIVRCTNNYVTDKCVTVHALTVGKEYEVLASTGGYIDVKNDKGYTCAYFSDRFELVSKENEEVGNMSSEFKIGEKACCLDAIGADYITEGKVYDILYMDENTITIEDDRGVPNPFIKRRFNPIKTVDATTITANGVTITDSEGNVVSGIDSTGEPYKVENEKRKPMLSMTKEDVDSALDIIDASTQIIQLPVDVNVLGTTYTIEVIPVEEDSYLENIYGYCDFLAKSIVIKTLKPTDYQGNIDAINAQYKINLRHELMHAFLYESGLDSSTLDGWARNEEMIDFMALQLPKIFRVFNDCGITE